LAKNIGKTIRKENLESEIALVLKEAKELGTVVEEGKIRSILGLTMEFLNFNIDENDDEEDKDEE
jgi:hypothetical protein